jgi:hypothetical protein
MQVFSVVFLGYYLYITIFFRDWGNWVIKKRTGSPDPLFAPTAGASNFCPYQATGWPTTTQPTCGKAAFTF